MRKEKPSKTTKSGTKAKKSDRILYSNATERKTTNDPPHSQPKNPTNDPTSTGETNDSQ